MAPYSANSTVSNLVEYVSTETLTETLTEYVTIRPNHTTMESVLHGIVTKHPNITENNLATETTSPRILTEYTTVTASHTTPQTSLPRVLTEYTTIKADHATSQTSLPRILTEYVTVSASHTAVQDAPNAVYSHPTKSLVIRDDDGDPIREKFVPSDMLLKPTTQTPMRATMVHDRNGHVFLVGTKDPTSTYMPPPPPLPTISMNVAPTDKISRSTSVVTGPTTLAIKPRHLSHQIALLNQTDRVLTHDANEHGFEHDMKVIGAGVFVSMVLLALGWMIKVAYSRRVKRTKDYY